MTHGTIAPHGLVRNIHRSAWKRNSANFALLDFYTLRRIAGKLGITWLLRSRQQRGHLGYPVSPVWRQC
jgi:hypothetical protein